MNKALLTGLLLSGSLTSLGQDVNPVGQTMQPIQDMTIRDKDGIALLQDHTRWYQGSIMLADGSEIKGLVKYNEQNGVLSYHDGENSKPFTARNIIAFEFFDEGVQRQRLFYSIEQEEQKTQILKHQIFEVIRDYKTFAILLRIDPIEIKQKSSSYSTPGNPLGRTQGVDVTQTETVYILDEQGKVRPYFQLVIVEDGRKSLLTNDDVKKKNKMIDEELLKQYVTEPMFEKMIVYAEQNKLKFKVKADFLKILEYYDSIREK